MIRHWQKGSPASSFSLEKEMVVGWTNYEKDCWTQLYSSMGSIVAVACLEMTWQCGWVHQGAPLLPSHWCHHAPNLTGVALTVALSSSVRRVTPPHNTCSYYSCSRQKGTVSSTAVSGKRNYWRVVMCTQCGGVGFQVIIKTKMPYNVVTQISYQLVSE